MVKNTHATIFKVYKDNPELSKIEKAVEVLKDGGVIIYPTDTVYAMGCDMYNSKAIDRITKIKSFSSVKPTFSIICENISEVSQYTKVIPNEIFKVMKKVLPGPYTFILETNNKVPKVINQKRKTIGVRVPDNEITLALTRALGHPLITTSIKEDDKVKEYFTNPDLIADRYEKQVDVIIDGGIGGNIPSTIVSFNGLEPEIIREGLGEINF